MDEQQEDAEHRWHIKRDVSVGHMISTAILALALATGWTDMSNRVARVEERTEQQQNIDRQQSQRMEQLQQGVDRKLHRIDTKLDRLIERELNNSTPHSTSRR